MLYSKWYAASEAAGAIATRLQLTTQEIYKGKIGKTEIKSDIDLYLFYITDFLKNVHSPDTATWESRRTRHNQIDDASFLQFLNQAEKLARAEAVRIKKEATTFAWPPGFKKQAKDQFKK